MAASAVKATYPTHPIPLLIMDASGNSKWTIPEDARRALQAINKPLTVVSIVGKFRGGKSYLMNILAGEKGFKMGSTTEPVTKGIWMWPRQHPKDENRCLLLLDTEGLHDAEKGDSNHDMQLFVFALLMSGCLIYNIKGVIDNTFIEELQFVTELADRIKVRTNQMKDDKEEDALQSYFPKLVVVLRDFHLNLPRIDGKPITSNEYLENALKSLPKFRRKKLQEEFNKKSKELAEHVFTTTSTMRIDGIEIKGSGFLTILEVYTTATNENGIPCIESAVDALRSQEHKRALRLSLETYRQGMLADLEGNMPVSTEYVKQLHSTHKQKSDEEYRRIVRIAADAKEHVEQIEKEFQEFCAQNNDSSTNASKAETENCFKELSGKIQSKAYFCIGGYKAFMDDQQKAKAQYEQATALGPMKNAVLEEKLESLKQTAEFILQSDRALNEKEKELERLKEREQKLEEGMKMQEQQLKEEKQEKDRIYKEHMGMIEKARQDFETMAKDKDETQKKAIESLGSEMKKLKNEGLKQQAELVHQQLQDLEKDRQKAEEDAKRENKRISDIMVKMTENHQTKKKKVPTATLR